jgi:2Fe-2S ferredoxin
MIKLSVVGRNGSATDVSVKAGLSLMEALRDAGVDEISALCGGCCSCATCHVFVTRGAERLSPGLSPASEGELDMLDGSMFRRGESRLACQLEVDASFDGLCVEIAPEE